MRSKSLPQAAGMEIIKGTRNTFLRAMYSRVTAIAINSPKRLENIIFLSGLTALYHYFTRVAWNT